MLFTHFYQTLGLSCNIIMESLARDTPVNDIKATANYYCNIAKYLPAGLALTVSDMTFLSQILNKVAMFNTLNTGNVLQLLEQVDCNWMMSTQKHHSSSPIVIVASLNRTGPTLDILSGQTSWQM